MTRWMLDTSALVRATCPDDLAARRRFFDTMEVLGVDATVWRVVDEMAEQLARAGAIVATGDVVIASCARIHQLTVVHYDADYQTLGQACGVEHAWVTPHGAL